jgi:hypothetical protein
MIFLTLQGGWNQRISLLRVCVNVIFKAMRVHPGRFGNPDVPQSINFFDGWTKAFEQENYDNAFKVQWELFLKHVVKDEPFPWDLRDGAKGVQLAEKGIESWNKRCWVDIPEL